MKKLVFVLCGCAISNGCWVGAHAADTKPDVSLKDYLVDTSGTYVGAAGIIGLESKLVRDSATPKDFVVSLMQAGSGEAKDGLGLAFSPGRSIFDLTSVNIRESGYSDPTTWLPARRLWSGTTFSYAQNRTKPADIEYRQRAAAVNVEYYVDLNDDPSYTAYRVIADESVGLPDSSDACKKVKAARESGLTSPPATLGKSSAAPTVRSSTIDLPGERAVAARRAEALRVEATLSTKFYSTLSAPGAAASPQSFQQLQDKAKTGSLTGTEVAQLRDKVAQEAAAEADALVEDIKQCAMDAAAAARKKWNATKFTALVGRGWIQGPGAKDPRLGLGTFVQMGYAMSPEQLMKRLSGGNSVHKPSLNLVTLTLNYGHHVLDTKALATPTYVNKSLMSVRYTRGWTEGLDSYLLAELSNAKERGGPVAAGAFKYALGWDYKLGANVWLQLRGGRAVTATGEQVETKVLANLKLALEPSLANLISGNK